MKWKTDKGFKVRLPRFIHCCELADLRDQLQVYADGYIPSEDSPPLGPLEYRWELDENEQPVVAHVYYVNKGGARDRFARLVRVS
jgi:hypothetical protein